ncbi:TspO/MBR family protein [Streptomyces sp. NPDC001594]|uniref:TspO/MBR family protein n=1 Tax=Streptomyces sp. NPDC001594 TaxID=3364590 RepID=UPI00367EB9FD
MRLSSDACPGAGATVREGRARRAGAWRSYAVSAAVVAAAAGLGAVAVDPDSPWYRKLRKPPWQPPGWAFGAVWTPLYAGIAWAGGRAWNAAPPGGRTALAGSFAANLALNAGWNWLFFQARSPAAGLSGTLALDLSNAELIRRTARADTAAAAALVPYALWCGFASALNASLLRRDRPRRPAPAAGPASRSCVRRRRVRG